MHWIYAVLLMSQCYNSTGRIFWKPVSFLQDERGGGNYVALSKLDQKMWRWLRTLVYLYLVWFVIFLNVMVLQVSDDWNNHDN